MYHGNLQAFDFSSNRHLVSRSSICMKNLEIILICSMVFGVYLRVYLVLAGVWEQSVYAYFCDGGDRQQIGST